MDNQTETLLEALVGIRFKLTPLDKSASDTEIAEQLFAAWNVGHLTVRDALNVPSVRMTGDQGDMEVKADRSIIQTLWFEREGSDIEESELGRLQALCQDAMQAVAREKGVLCTPLSAKYVRRVEHLVFKDFNR